MGTLAERLKGLFERFKGLSLGKKTGYIMLVIVVIVAISSLSFYTTSTKYSILFSNMDPTDSKTVLDKLNALKEPNKVQGTSILVPTKNVDNLRLQLASSLTNGSKGFELFDEGSPFGMTDQQMTIEFQRAMEGELERTLKGFSQVDGARVHLVMQQDSAFVQDSTASTASVTLKLKPGTVLSNDQVKSIVALISGSVKNLKKENVQVVDNKMKLLTSNLFSAEEAGQSIDVASATANQLKQKTEYENVLKQKILEIVQPVALKGNVKVTVNADMDFNSQQIASTIVDANGAKVSEKITDNTSVNGGAINTAGSGVDANTNPSSVGYAAGTNAGTNSSTNKETMTNYDNGKTETKTNVAPGKVLRLTASIMLDAGLSDADKATLTNSISNAIGFDASRNDTISVAAMKFNTSGTEAVASDLALITAANQAQIKQKLYEYIGIGIGALAVLLILMVSFKKRGANKVREVAGLEQGGLNVLLGDEIMPKEAKPIVIYDPIDFEPKNENSHLESEIRKYAKEKPEQVSDIVKAWLADEER
ncbi:MAG: flagellar M-ring protein FliF [Clostridiaceae bacterium]|nr:flagellar M-ring protein FliF [Clostridiaceae bacterium]